MLQTHFIAMYPLLIVYDGRKKNSVQVVKNVTATIYWAAMFHPIYKPK